MLKLFSFLVPAIALFGSASAAAAPINQIPSCYVAGKLDTQSSPAQRALFIVLDETVVLDDELKRSLWDLVKPIIKPGIDVSIYRFSAYSQGRYLDVVASGTLEAPIPAGTRDSISVPKLKTFDACMNGQVQYGLTLTRNAIGKILAASTFDLAKSDIDGTLFALSKVVKDTKAPIRTVLLVSDMLENSTVSSFYQNRGVRNIDPTAELKKVETAKLFGDFGGASVYVMGAGLIQQPSGPGKAAQYRDTKTMSSLQQFWSAYFERSNARLEAFGTPVLLTPIR